MWAFAGPWAQAFAPSDLARSCRCCSASADRARVSTDSAMPMMQALKLCPNAIVISGSHGDDMIFGFAGSDTFLASDGLDTYADFASHADVFATDFLPTAGTFNFQYEAKGTGGVVQQAGKGVMNFIGDYAGVDFTDMAQVLLASMPSGGFYSPSNQGLQILLLIHDVPRGNSYLYEARDTQANLVINASDSIELVGIFKGALLAQGDITGV